MSSVSEIYSYKSSLHHRCSIHDEKDYYELRASSGKVTFDKSEQTLSTIIREIEQHGIPWFPNGYPFFRKGNSLVRIIYGTYNGADNPQEKVKRFHYLDGNPCNLRSNNIDSTPATEVKPIILAGKKYILLQPIKDRTVFAVTDYSEGLYAIMREVSWQYNKDSRVFYCRSRRSNYYLHQLIWVHHQYGATADNWISKVDDLYKDDTNIDHKKSGTKRNPRWDNRIANLQLMDKKENSVKRNCTSVLKPNCFYLPIESGAVYGAYTDAASHVIVHVDGNSLTINDVNNLRYFCKTGEFSDETTCNELDISSPEALKILMADLQEAKFYQEVYTLEY